MCARQGLSDLRSISPTSFLETGSHYVAQADPAVSSPTHDAGIAGNVLLCLVPVANLDDPPFPLLPRAEGLAPS